MARLPRADGMNMSPNSSIGFKSMRSTHKRSGTLDVTNPNFQGSHYATPFILQKDASNRHKVDN